MSGFLRLDFSGGALEAEYQRCVRGMLKRSEVPPEDGPESPFDGDMNDPAVELARENWRYKMRQEHDSTALFSGLVPQLMACGAPVDLKMACLRSAMDELRHAKLCADVVRYLGGEPELKTELAVPPLAEHPGCAPAEVALRNVLFIGCLSETVAVAFLTECREHIEDPWIARVNQQLLSDETLHARLGWLSLPVLLPRLDDAGRERLNRFLPVALGYFEQEFMERSRGAHIEEGLLNRARALGYSYGKVARELMQETLEEVIIPSFEAIGLPAERAWRERRAPGASPHG